MIFITENDVMKAGLPIYHIDRVVRETGKLFEDEEHIIYVNSQIKDETKLGRLMHDFSCTDAKDMYNKVLQIVSGILKKMREEWRLCVVRWK